MKKAIIISFLSFILMSPFAFQEAHAASQTASVFDIDGNGEVKPLTDGLLVFRYLFNFRGDVLINNIIGRGATRTTVNQIETYLSDHLSDLDIDGNGETKPLSDGLLLLRFLFDFEGDVLINNAISANATRTKIINIKSYIQTGDNMPPEITDLNNATISRHIALKYHFADNGSGIVESGIYKGSIKVKINDMKPHDYDVSYYNGILNVKRDHLDEFGGNGSWEPGALKIEVEVVDKAGNKTVSIFNYIVVDDKKYSFLKLYVLPMQ